ncbi:MscS family membrane protein [Clostridium cavendishii DSM 21758]|uniref:MscS family membrane protein n=1 Tax=Clostridium cavendishii DSM 21758 TaxID=1121302 RepID=A0A1M6VTW5_9CLOT|nr:mechanosensitive ion channel family protein [Clostridium cavendishii]SHK84953.1 MscS family membrane protein [Clostridium cavendishii DSM 21758]
MADLEIYLNFILNNPIERIVVALFIIYFFILVNKYIICRVLNLILKLVDRTDNNFDNNLIKAGIMPIKLLIIFIGIYLALEYINIGNVRNIPMPNNKFIKSAIVIVVGLFLYNLTLEDSILYCRIKKKENIDKIVFPFISIGARLIVIVICISIIAKEFGFTGFITGLGVSGIALALAAQDTFSNLFGGIIIVLDKPFAIGDWIQTETVEGTVEQITFRSTRVRAFSKAIVTVPNSKLANSNIINWTQRGMRRIHFKFVISFETDIEKIESIIKEIELMLNNNKKVEKELIIVSLSEITVYGYGIFIYFYTNIIDYKEYEKVKENINLNIIKILQSSSIKFAYPILGMDDKINKEKLQIETIKNINQEEIT